jgi:hypothetical protein
MMDKEALEDSFATLVRNLDSYFATMDNMKYGHFMTQVSIFLCTIRIYSHHQTLSQLFLFFKLLRFISNGF